MLMCKVTKTDANYPKYSKLIQNKNSHLLFHVSTPQIGGGGLWRIDAVVLQGALSQIS